MTAVDTHSILPSRFFHIITIYNYYFRLPLKSSQNRREWKLIRKVEKPKDFTTSLLDLLEVPLPDVTRMLETCDV